MFLCKRARLDIIAAISFLKSQVKDPNKGDWNKLVRSMGYLKGTKNEILTLEPNVRLILMWYIDAAFTVPNVMKSHTGMIFTLGKGAVFANSIIQKTNLRSSTEAELNGIDNKIGKVI